MDINKFFKVIAFTIGTLFILGNTSPVKANWQIETVDSEGRLGDYSSLALDSSNNPHITYYEWNNRDLKYAHYDGNWHIEVLEYAGSTSLAIDNNDNLHLSYKGDVYLKYLHYDGSWHREAIDVLDTYGPCSSNSIALGSGGTPHISYYDSLSDDLNYAYYSNGSWNITTIDSTGDVGGYNSIAIDSVGKLHISYYDFTNQDLKYAWCDMNCGDTTNWHTETLDSIGDMGTYTNNISIALDSSNNPHISYFDGTNSDLRYAHYDGSWHMETIDSTGNVGSYASLALDSLDNIHISYYDQGNGDLKYAYYDGTWHLEAIDSSGNVGQHTSIAIGTNNRPHISYYDYTKCDLKYAFFVCPDDFDCDDVLDNDDNCPMAHNPNQEDSDGDEVGDVCDNCPADSNTSQDDGDEDGIGNVCDNCPLIANSDQKDLDRDEIGDICDDDLDGDGMLNVGDNCSTTPNPNQEDSDKDGFGDACDSENSFALIDWFANKLSIFDLSYNQLYEKEFNGIGNCYFVSPSALGWLVKGCPLPGCSTDNWIIWDLKPDGSIRNTITDLGPGPYYTGLTSGNFLSGNVYEGIISLYNTSGSIINSVNVWEEENGWPFDYTHLGDITGLANGGFVVPPAGGYPNGGGLYTPYLYFYDNDFNLINKVDIISESIHLFVLAGLSCGEFVATCADSGSSNVDYLCFFNSVGELTEKRDITGDIPEPRNYINLFLTGLSDGGVMLSKYGEDKVWVYHSPPEELNLSSFGVSEIGSVAGNILVLDSDSDQIPNVNDNCPNHHNPNQEDTYPPGRNGIGDACDCEGNFNCDASVGSDDVGKFIADTGRNTYNDPCTNGNPCNGDFLCDGSVDSLDVSVFLEDTGRNTYNNPCPICVVGAWCSY